MSILDFIFAFLIGGVICMVAQLIMDRFNLMPIHMTVMFVALGACLEAYNLYDMLVDFAGAGAMLPISSFGHSLTDAALKKATEVGYIGIFEGMFASTSVGIIVAILSSFLMSLIFKPRG